MPKKLIAKKLYVVLAVFIAGCAVGADYERPETAISGIGSYIEAPAGEQAHRPDISRWWEELDDPEMDRLVAVLLSENLSLKQAEARIRQAWETRNIEYGNLSPNLSARATANRNFRPAQEFSNLFGGAGGLDGAGGGDTARVFDTSIEAGLATSWQLDLFGKIWRGGEAAQARALAQEADYQALVHSLIAELARLRVTIAVMREQLALARRTIENRKTILQITERRYETGNNRIASTDLYRARESLASAKAEALQIEQDLKSRQYTMDVLLGRAPGAESHEAARLNLPPMLKPVPVGVPAGLIDRRPDIMGAELRLIAATHDVGIAVSNLYPDVTLSGNLGFEDESFANLFSAERLIGSLLSELSMALFQGGSLRAKIRLDEARAEELAALYAETVLTALQEVETALSNEKFLAKRTHNLEQAKDAAQETAQSLRSRYERGVASLFDLLDAEQRSYQTAQQFLAAQQALWNARIDLYLALGGDWFAQEHEEHKEGTKT